MDEAQITNLLGQGGAFGVLALILWKIGTAIVQALRDLRTDLAEHTKLDLAHHARVREDLAEIRGNIDGILDQAGRFTPVEVPRPQRPRTEPGGEYLVNKRKGGG